MHRWDLTERVDNPRLNVNVKGRWNVGAANLVAEEIAVEGPRSNLRGMFRSLAEPTVDGIALGFTGDSGIGLVGLVSRVSSGRGGECHGGTVFYGWDDPARWPLVLESAALSSSGGIVRVPGFAEPVRIGPLSGGRERGMLAIEPVRVALGGEIRDVMAPKRRRAALAMEKRRGPDVYARSTHACRKHQCRRKLQQGRGFSEIICGVWAPAQSWLGIERTGDCGHEVEWKQPLTGRWNGRIGFNKANLTVAGLNQPLKISEVRWIGSTGGVSRA